MSVSRRDLFSKLNVTLFLSLDAATAFAKLREPVCRTGLHQMLQLAGSDPHRILRHFDLDPGRGSDGGGRTVLPGLFTH